MGSNHIPSHRAALWLSGISLPPDVTVAVGVFLFRLKSIASDLPWSNSTPLINLALFARSFDTFLATSSSVFPSAYHEMSSAKERELIPSYLDSTASKMPDK